MGHAQVQQDDIELLLQKQGRDIPGVGGAGDVPVTRVVEDYFPATSR